jgi:hypothetical protein
MVLFRRGRLPRSVRECERTVTATVSHPCYTRQLTATIHLQLLLSTFAGWVGEKIAIITYLVDEHRALY